MTHATKAVTLLAGAAILAFPLAAEAHTVTGTPTCTGASITATDFPPGTQIVKGSVFANGGLVSTGAFSFEGGGTHEHPLTFPLAYDLTNQGAQHLVLNLSYVATDGSKTFPPTVADVNCGTPPPVAPAVPVTPESIPAPPVVAGPTPEYTPPPSPAPPPVKVEPLPPKLRTPHKPDRAVCKTRTFITRQPDYQGRHHVGTRIVLHNGCVRIYVHFAPPVTFVPVTGSSLFQARLILLLHGFLKWTGIALAGLSGAFLFMGLPMLSVVQSMLGWDQNGWWISTVAFYSLAVVVGVISACSYLYDGKLGRRYKGIDKAREIVERNRMSLGS